MIDEILRNNLIIREWVNGGLIPLNLSLVIVIGLFLWEAWKEADRDSGRWDECAVVRARRSYVKFVTTPGAPTACALIWIFTADATRAGAAWFILWTANNRVPATVSTVENIWVSCAFIVAGIIGLVASIRCIYLFTPPWLGHWYWIGSVALTLAFQLVT